MRHTAAFRATVLTPSGLAHVGVRASLRGRGETRRLRVRTDVTGPGRIGAFPVDVEVRAASIDDVPRGATVEQVGESAHRIVLPLVADARDRSNEGTFRVTLARGDESVVLGASIGSRTLEVSTQRGRRRFAAASSGVLTVVAVVGAVALVARRDESEERSLASEAAEAGNTTTLPPVTTVVPTTVAPAASQRLALFMMASAVSAKGPAHLLIPRMNLSTPIVEGTSDDKLDEGVGRYLWTAKVGDQGNIGLAGHRTTPPAPFRHLDVVVPGDLVGIVKSGVLAVYEVEAPPGAKPGEGHLIVKPNDVSVLDNRGYGGLTLTTCHPVGSTDTRLVVFGKLTDTQPITTKG